MLIDAYYGRLSQETLKGFSGSVLYQETLKNLSEKKFEMLSILVCSL